MWAAARHLSGRQTSRRFPRGRSRRGRWLGPLPGWRPAEWLRQWRPTRCCPLPDRLTVAVNPSRRDEHYGAALFGHHAVIFVPIVVVPPQAVNTSRRRSRRCSAPCSHRWVSSGPASSAVPSTVAHCQPLRNVTASWGRARRLASDSSVGDKAQHGQVGGRVCNDAGVDQRCLDGVIGPQC